ncbi:MAG: hypothetical protein DRN20_01325 [Thermoplasmata archaeon]|nr:MAG: hypothetical protein DRN20_01325 [Thermoplasmata archaeon]
MKREKYLEIVSALESVEDVRRISETMGIDERTVFSIYAQKVVRDAKKRYYVVKSMGKVLLKRWMRGESLLSIARSVNFPPVLTAQIVLTVNRMSKRKFWEFINNVDRIDDERLRKELAEVVNADHVYSPCAMLAQAQMGRMGEKALYRWLSRHKIAYRRESEIRNMYPKTPDALLLTPIMVEGDLINWIESKACFGDYYEIRRHSINQFIPYVNIFGSGAVVYWFDYVEDVRLPKGVRILSPRFFDGERL